MSRRLIVCVVVLATLLSVSAQGEKRRAVRAPSAAPPATGTCHTFGLVRAGLVASYVSNPPTNFTITYISDTMIKTVTHQKVTTPQATAEADTILDGEVVNNLRGIKHVNIKTTTQAPVIGSFTIENDLDFVPSLIAGPSNGWCVGNKWSVPAVTETLTTKSPIAPPASIIKTTIASEGEVLAVGESLTVPAGTYQTVKYKGVVITDGNVQTAITWVSMEHNIVIKQQTLDANGAVTSSFEMVSLQ
jgi:hypothetical protein